MNFNKNARQLIAPYGKKLLDNWFKKFSFFSTQQFLLPALAIIFSFIASSLIIPQAYLEEPDFAVGSIAKRNIKADHAFLVEDRQATENKRLEALKAVRPVYDFNENIAEEIAKEITVAFEALRLLQNKYTPEAPDQELTLQERQFKSSWEKSYKVSLSNEQFRRLVHLSPQANIRKKLKNLIAAIYRDYYITDHPLRKADEGSTIIVRYIPSGKQEPLDITSQPLLPVDKVAASLRKGNLSRYLAEDLGNRELLIQLVTTFLRPNLTYNEQATQLYRKQLLAEVSPVFSQILKNEMLVREGQKITAHEAAKLEAYFNEKDTQLLAKTLKFFGVFFATLLVSFILYQVAKRWHKPELDFRGLLFLAATSFLQLVIVKVGFFLAESVNDTLPSLQVEAFYFSIPFAVGAMLVAILINHNLAILYSVFNLFLVGFLFEGKISMALYFFVGSVAAAGYLRECQSRSAFFRAGLYLGAVNTLTILIIVALSGNFAATDMLWKLIMGFIGGIVSGFIVAGITPVFESIFDYTTEFKLMELGNLNNPLFQKMIIEAPGTYHHSIMVASLVEGAARSIGANHLLAKVSAYYHDIGKLKKPHYFIENQVNGENRHDKLSSKISSLIIISHVKEGCELAAKVKLTGAIRSIIQQHHGNSLVEYFWEKAKRENGGHNNGYTENDFRYPGPKPQTREAGLVLLGDVIEASSRVLKNPTPARITNLVRERIEKVFLDGQLDECDITLRDLNTIADTFIKILIGMFHHRIEYPEPAAREDVTSEKRENHETADCQPSETTKARPSPYPQISSASV